MAMEGLAQVFCSGMAGAVTGNGVAACAGCAGGLAVTAKAGGGKSCREQDGPRARNLVSLSRDTSAARGRFPCTGEGEAAPCGVVVTKRGEPSYSPSEEEEGKLPPPRAGCEWGRG